MHSLERGWHCDGFDAHLIAGSVSNDADADYIGFNAFGSALRRIGFVSLLEIVTKSALLITTVVTTASLPHGAIRNSLRMREYLESVRTRDRRKRDARGIGHANSQRRRR